MRDAFFVSRSVHAAGHSIEIDDIHKLWRIKTTFGVWTTFQFSHVTEVSISENGVSIYKAGSDGTDRAAPSEPDDEEYYDGAENYVIKLNVQVLLKDVSDRPMSIQCLKRKAKRDSGAYRSALGTANQIAGIFQYIISRSSDEEREKRQPDPYVTDRAIAEQARLKRRLIGLGAALLLLVVLIAVISRACSAGGENEPSPSPSTQQSTGPSSDESAPPASPSAEPSADPSTPAVRTGTVVNTESGVNVRSQPSTDSQVLGMAQKGQAFTVTQAFFNADWHQIDYNGQVAYIHKDYLQLNE